MTVTHWTNETRDVLTIIEALVQSNLRQAKVEMPTAKGVIRIEVRK